MEYLWVALIGLVIGLVARFLLPGRDPIGLIGTLAVGVIGALVGTWLWNMIFPDNDNSGVAFFAGLVVAIVLLLIIRAVMGRSRTTA